MEHKKVDLETLQQHVDAQQLLIALSFAVLAEENPDTLSKILYRLRRSLDTTPQMHPKMREILETGYMTLAEMLTGDGGRH